MSNDWCRRFAAFAAVIALSGCSSSNNSNQPSSQQLTDFVATVQTSDGSITASRQSGSPPAANGGPTVTVTATDTGTSSATVVSGGASTVNLRTSSPFTTVYVQVVDDPLTGYYQLNLSSPATSLSLLLKYGSSIPINTFQTVFSVANGTSVGQTASLSNTSKTLTSVVVSGTAPTLGSSAQQFTATANFSDNSNQTVTGDATWASSATSVATVSSSGLVSAVGAGTANISAAYGGVTGQQSITITGSGGTTPTTFTVSGTVTDGTSGGRLPNINIAIGGRTTTTDSSGNYSISGLSAGSVTVTASAVSYFSSSNTITLSSNTTVNFVLTRIVPSVTVSVTGGSCTADNGSGMTSCTWNATASNISSPTYSWTFSNTTNSNTASAPNAASVQPLLSCAFVGFPTSSFTVNATVTVTGSITGGAGSANVSASAPATVVTRSPPCI